MIRRNCAVLALLSQALRKWVARAAFSALIGVGYFSIAEAQWNGVSLDVSQSESSWEFDGSARKARLNRYSIRAEEFIASGFLLGVGGGYLDLRLASETFGGNFFKVYLSHKSELSSRLSLNARVDVSIYNARDTSPLAEGEDPDQSTIDWLDLKLELGASLKMSQFRITPYLIYANLSGDIDELTGSTNFKAEKSISGGLHLDVFTEPTAFVRLSLQDGADSGVWLNFSRQYW